MNVMCARSVFVILVICKGTCVFTRTRNRTSVMCARSVLVNLVICKGTCVLNISSSFIVLAYMYTFSPWAIDREKES